ncbi:MAG TPA: hypothetical protein VHG09_04590, partial [Longimicrobiales bacterium]|nr:hypothetical protein [Longimicrobiales bacterium]
ERIQESIGMRQDRRDGVRRGRRDYPLALGVIASALLHLLVLVVNPVMETPAHGRAGGTPSTPGAQFTVLSLSPRDEDELLQIEAAPPPATERTTPFGTPGADPPESAGSGRATGTDRDAEATVAERLRYHARPFSEPVPMREASNQRALRETRERVLRAGRELGPLPPNRVAASGGGGGGGVSIPFGFKPPPPAQTVPAPPLPDSILLQDSIRAAARAVFLRDSLRVARDTTRLRNVAPRPRVVLPRVVPDTTMGSR